MIAVALIEIGTAIMILISLIYAIIKNYHER